MINPYAQTFMIATRLDKRPQDLLRPYKPSRPSALRRYFSRTRDIAAK